MFLDATFTISCCNIQQIDFVVPINPLGKKSGACCWHWNQHLDCNKCMTKHILKYKETLMFCFMGLEDGINFDSLKKCFGQIHSSTNEGIVT